MNITVETTELGSDATLPAHDLSGVSNADLLDAWHQDHEPAAMAALVDRYSVMVLSVCRRRCRSHADAEDAYQTTFLYLARNSNKIRHPERLAGWLHRVAQRAAVAVTQSCKRETETMAEPIANTDDPLDRLTQRHEAIVLDEELSELPEHYRAAIVMHLYEGSTLESLAVSLGTTVGSVRGRLQRGKKLLADRLRRRGVVPVLAFAAANALTVSTATAAQASEPLIDSLHRGDLPDSPVDPHLLDSLLSQGTRLMPSLLTTL
uniref:RNA polymerase sigma factor n=1 Tax=Novipirellula sp. TaxID=2795430 RepID=UPI0035644ECE